MKPTFRFFEEFNINIDHGCIHRTFFIELLETAIIGKGPLCFNAQELLNARIETHFTQFLQNLGYYILFREIQGECTPVPPEKGAG